MNAAGFARLETMENQRFFGRKVKKISNRMPQLDKVGWDSRHNAVGFYSGFGGIEGAARGDNTAGYSGIGATVGSAFHAIGSTLGAYDKDTNDITGYFYSIGDVDINILEHEAKKAALLLKSVANVETFRTAATYAKGASFVGYGLAALDVALAIREYKTSPQNWGDATKLGINVGNDVLGVVQNPYAMGASIVIGIAENAGVFDGLYQKLNQIEAEQNATKYDLWTSW